MLKVLIIDDEEKVCRLIQCLIDWESLGLHIAGICHDGLLALDMVKETSPDIIITDIRMPGCDGLTLIRAAKEFNPGIHFIIISGYGQFDYAQRAIQYGVSDYILKPIKEKDLKATLVSIVEKQQSMESHKQQDEAIRKELNSTQERIKSNFINDLILNPQIIQAFHSIEDINRTYYTDFKESAFTLLCIYLDTPDENGRTIVSDFLVNKAAGIIDSETGQYHDCSMTVSGKYIYCLVNDNEEQLSHIYQTSKSIRGALLSLKEIFPELHVILLQSGIKNTFAEITDCFGEIESALCEKVLSGSDAIYSYSRIPICKNQVSDFITPSFRSQYLSYAETFQYEKLREFLSGLAHQLVHLDSVTGAFIRRVYNEIVTLFLFCLNQHKINISSDELTDKWNTCFLSFTSVYDVFSYLAEEQCALLQDWKSHKKKAQSKAVLTAKQYINENYEQSLTLEQIGQVVGLNASYFSNIFKKETGISFIEYLTDVRIQNAKDLLTETDLEIIEIAERTGFHDLKYFIRCFRKTTGMTPAAYRKLFS